MEKKFAVFIDGDNISAKYYLLAIREIANYGEIAIKQVWGDYTTTNMKTWKNILAKEPETIQQQLKTGKNSTDTRIVIEATKLMLSDTNVNAYCIVSSDADFHVLAQELRANGKYVLGVGEEKKINLSWREACNEFVTFESLKCQEIGILLERPKHFGLIRVAQRSFYFNKLIKQEVKYVYRKYVEKSKL